MAAVLFSMWFAQAHALWLPATASAFVSHIATRYGGYSPPIYSLVHHRPMEVCDTYVADKSARMAALASRPVDDGPWSSMILLRAYDEDARAVLMGPCRGQWVFQPGSGAHLFAQFARDAWAAWLFERLGVTDAKAALFVMVGAVVGAFALARLAFAVTGSTVMAVVLVGIAGTVDRAIAPWFTPVNVFAWYGFSTVWLITMFGRPGRRSLLTWAVLVPAFAVNALGYLVVAHSSAFLSVGVAVGLLGLAAAAAPSRACAVSVAMVATIVALGLYDCSQFARRQLAPISTANFASSGSFGEFALTTGFWTERPNPWSYPLGDAGVFAAVAAEPLVWASAPATFEYQGFALVGQQLLRRMLFEHPLIVLDNAWRRMALMVVRLPSLARPTYRLVPNAIEAARVMAVIAWVVLLAAVVQRAAWSLELPLAGLLVWNFFGLETLTHVVHTHTNYLIAGLLQLLLAAPLLAWVLVGQARTAALAMRHVGRLRNARLAAAAVIAVLAAVHVVHGLRQELATFEIWYQPWLGKDVRPVKDALLTDTLAQRVEDLRAFGEPSPGSISMYGAWAMSRLSTEVWTPALGEKLAMTAAEVAAQKQRAETLMVEYFRRAQAEAPDDPWVPTFAWMLDPASASTVYQRALERQPDGIFSTWFAKYLYNTVPGGQKYGDQFETMTHARLAASARVRPGFVEIPPVIADRARSSVVDGYSRVTIEPGGSVVVGPANGYATDRAKVFLFARVLTGAATAAIEVRDARGIHGGASQNLSATDGVRYRFFEWTGREQLDAVSIRMTAGPAGAELDLRDFYPLIENPHHLAW